MGCVPAAQARPHRPPLWSGLTQPTLRRWRAALGSHPRRALSCCVRVRVLLLCVARRRRGRAALSLRRAPAPASARDPRPALGSGRARLVHPARPRARGGARAPVREPARASRRSATRWRGRSKRRRARRRRDECLLDLARPDENWWLSFATDAAPASRRGAARAPGAPTACLAIGRALIPLDDHAAQLIDELDATTAGPATERRRPPRAVRARRACRAARSRLAFTSPPERTRGWRGSIEVDGPSEQPVFLLLGDIARLPRALRERAVSAPGGAAVALTLDSWRPDRRAARTAGSAPAARRCVAALKDGRPAPPAVLERSAVHDEETFVLAPGHDAGAARAVRCAAAAHPACAPRRAVQHEHARLPAIRADPFCVQELDRFLAAARGLGRARGARAAAGDPRAARPRGRPGGALGGDRRAPRRARPRRRAQAVPACGRQLPALPAARVPGRRAGARQDDRGARDARGRRRLPGRRRVSREPQAQLAARARALAAGPHRRRCSSAPAPAAARAGADITIVNYDIVARAAGARCAPWRRARSCSTSPTTARTPAAKRTQAVQRLAAAVPRGRARPRAHGHPGDEPAGGADIAAADPRAARRLRLGRAVRRALSRRRRPPAPALASARALLRAPPEGRRAAAAAGQDARDRAGRAGQRARVSARRARRRRVAAEPAARPARARREGGGGAARRAPRAAERAQAARRARQAPRRARLDPRLLLLRRAAGRVRPPSRDPAGAARALPERAAHPRRGQPRRQGRGAARLPGARRRRRTS